MSALIKNLIFGIALAVILWLGYTLFFKNDEVALDEDIIAGEASIQAQEFLLKLQELRELELDGAFFEDPRFDALVDHRQNLTEEPYGRTNPFAPVGR